MPIPITYRKSNESIIASYSFTDIAEGTGVVQFYGASVSTGTATNIYILTTNSGFYSSQGGVFSLGGGGTFTQDFDVIFNLPKVIYGNCYINFPVDVSNDSGTATSYIVCSIKKISDGTTTTIGASTQSENFVLTGVTHSDYKLSLRIPVAITTFKSGDTLRLSLSCTVSHSGGGSIPGSSVAFAPTGSQGATGGGFANNGTRMSFFVPFKIDL